MRRTRHRRRFHTDRIVAARRARYLRERPTWVAPYDDASSWAMRRLAYGRLAKTDPWDCGGPCRLCHLEKRIPGRRAQATRAWLELESSAW